MDYELISWKYGKHQFRWISIFLVSLGQFCFFYLHNVLPSFICFPCAKLSQDRLRTTNQHLFLIWLPCGCMYLYTIRFIVRTGYQISVTTIYTQSSTMFLRNVIVIFFIYAAICNVHWCVLFPSIEFCLVVSCFVLYHLLLCQLISSCLTCFKFNCHRNMCF